MDGLQYYLTANTDRLVVNRIAQIAEKRNVPRVRTTKSGQRGR